MNINSNYSFMQIPKILSWCFCLLAGIFLAFNLISVYKLKLKWSYYYLSKKTLQKKKLNADQKKTSLFKFWFESSFPPVKKLVVK